jgi:hypothetical protein
MRAPIASARICMFWAAPGRPEPNATSNVRTQPVKVYEPPAAKLSGLNSHRIILPAILIPPFSHETGHRIAAHTSTYALMKVFIEHKSTRLLLSPRNRWTPRLTRARDFQRIIPALKHCLLHKLNEISILLRFGDPALDAHLDPFKDSSHAKMPKHLDTNCTSTTSKLPHPKTPHTKPPSLPQPKRQCTITTRHGCSSRTFSP